VRKLLLGSALGAGGCVAVGACMVPFRSHLSLATAALVLVVPVVAGVVVGGIRAGLVSTVAGFLVYDLAFVPPYGRLSASSAQDWVALVVYIAVVLLVARLVANLEAARAEAQRRADEARRLFDLSELLVEGRSVDDLLKTIVHAVATVFTVPAVSVLVPEGDRLVVAASAGDPLTPDELRRLDPHSGVPVALGTSSDGPEGMRTLALSAGGRPVGILALRGGPISASDRALLRTFTNHAALTLERAQLREQAMRSELLEEVDRLRHALVGAVSHDLRTPLATMKVASSTLLDPKIPVSEAMAKELYGLIDTETDRLTRLVTSLLDMTRVDAGVLDVRRQPTPLDDLVAEAVTSVLSALEERSLRVEHADDLPMVDADPLLIAQVLANLLDNAVRHAPSGSVITVAAEPTGDQIAVSVTDSGPGVPSDEHEAVFNRFVRFDTGGRAGLGLSIAKTFIEAHGEDIWVEDVVTGGARFVFTLSAALSPATPTVLPVGVEG
jgi:two-component system, OmpR family, sensor histidine kinase KdpD